jgi:DNA-binding transcriptional ArsR family regulator
MSRDQALYDQMQARAEAAAGLLRTLANPGRLKTLCLLADGEKSVADLAQRLGMAQPSVSQQLARLRLEGLVAPRRDGRTIYYAIADDRVRPVLAAMQGAFCGGAAD